MQTLARPSTQHSPTQLQLSTTHLGNALNSNPACPVEWALFDVKPYQHGLPKAQERLLFGRHPPTQHTRPVEWALLDFKPDQHGLPKARATNNPGGNPTW